MTTKWVFFINEELRENWRKVTKYLKWKHECKSNIASFQDKYIFGL